jgi:hypothetical protein
LKLEIMDAIARALRGRAAAAGVLFALMDRPTTQDGH